MKLEMERIAIEMMKPSIPTPPELKSFKLSSIDQLLPLTYQTKVLFYKLAENVAGSKNSGKAIVSCLKESLSKTLYLFYPLAGRLTIDESSIDCNDKGVLFIEARVVNTSVCTYLKASNRVDLVGRFIPETIISESNAEAMTVTELVPVSIQISVFNCGGFAIGAQLLHKLCDGPSWGIFLNTWATITAGLKQNNINISTPDLFTGSSLFPSSGSLPSGSKAETLKTLDDGTGTGPGGCIVKTFVFTPQAINSIKALSTSQDVPNPTRIESVSGFIWKHAMAAAAAARISSSSSPSALSGPSGSVICHSVNIRPYTNPPLSSNSFGNLGIGAFINYETNNQTRETKTNLSDLVAQIRKGMARIKNADFLSKFQGERGAATGALRNYYMENTKHLKDKNRSLTTYCFSSWLNFGLNADFGFGPPLWIGVTGGRVSSSFKNLIFLVDTTDCGIEAWLILDQQEGSVLQSDPDFLQFASPTQWTIQDFKRGCAKL